MIRARLLLSAAIASSALVLGLPALASGSALTESGKLLAVGSVFTATSTNSTVESATLGTHKCGEEVITSKLSVNNGSKVEAVSGGAGTTKECTAGGKAAPKTDVTFHGLATPTSGSGTIWMTFEIDWALSFKCHYEGTSVPFTYTPGTNKIHVSGSVKSAVGLCGTAKVTGTYSLYKSGVPLILD